MRNHRMMFASALAGSIAGLGVFTSQRNDPRHWNVEPHFGVSHLPMAGADAERYAAAQAKRDRKAAKRLRDAKGGGDA